ncbi:MAG TPA: ATP-binding protein [Thermoanaerobaculia bacterium]|nr:ATP-binding protein [Thermoanaerobaculia bacterium]
MTLSIASSFDNIELAQFVCDYVLRPWKLPADTTHAISMALREGVANAIKHGNRGDAGKRVSLTLQVEEDVFRMAIADEGGGFRPEQVADPLAPENRLKASGRGIFYMKTFMDEVRYDFSRGGTEVVLEKKLVAEEPE